MRQGHVGLPDVPLPELLIQVLVGRGVLGEEDDPADLLVQAVDDVEPPRPGRLQQGKQAISSFVAFRNGRQTFRFVDGQEVVALKKNRNHSCTHFLACGRQTGTYYSTYSGTLPTKRGHPLRNGWPLLSF